MREDISISASMAYSSEPSAPRRTSSPRTLSLVWMVSSMHSLLAPKLYIYPWQRHLLDMRPPVVRAFCWSSGIPLSLVSLGCAWESIHQFTQRFHRSACSGLSVSHNYCISTRCINRSVHRVVQVEFRVENSWASEFQWWCPEETPRRWLPLYSLCPRSLNRSISCGQRQYTRRSRWMSERYLVRMKL